MSRKGDVIIALDFPSATDVFSFLDRFNEEKPYVKIGMELFYSEGPQIVREIKARGHRIFLDLKLHDIPNTVKRAMKALSALGADMVNLHAAGTIPMMKAALEGLTRPDGTRPLVIAVTQLTSTGEAQLKDELLISASMPETVIRYAQNAKAAGLDGVVCSPLEAAQVRAACGQGLPHRYPGRALRGRPGGRSTARDDSRAGTAKRQRLYRGRPPDHPGGRSQGRVPPVCERFFGIRR